jgi:hypothetical protein
MLDLTGELPMPADVQEFLADKDPKKRARLIDKLLASDEFARHQARYWRDVIAGRSSDPRGRLLQRPFEEWMAKQGKKNTGWGEVVKAMLTAEGELRSFDNPNGAGYFLGSHMCRCGQMQRAVRRCSGKLRPSHAQRIVVSSHPRAASVSPTASSSASNSR